MSFAKGRRIGLLVLHQRIDSCAPCGAVVIEQPENSTQRGFILIIVIWMMAFLSLVAVAVTRSVQAHIRQTANHVQARNAELLADAGISLAMLDLVKAQGRGEGRASASAGKLRRFPIDGSTTQCALDDAVLSISVQDTGGLISLSTGSERLLQALFLGLGTTLDTARRAADTIIDFRDADELRRPSGAEKPEYATAGRTLGPKNEPFDAVEELHQVLGLDARLISTMKPYVTVHSGTAGLDPRVTSMALAELITQGAAQLPNTPLTTPRFGAAKAVLPSDFIIGSTQRGFNITVHAEISNTAVYVRDAVVDLSSVRDGLPTIKSWRRGRHLAPTPRSIALPSC